MPRSEEIAFKRLVDDLTSTREGQAAKFSLMNKGKTQEEAMEILTKDIQAINSATGWDVDATRKLFLKKIKEYY